MSAPKTLSLETLPMSEFSYIQISKFDDGCYVISVSTTIETDSLVNKGKKDIQGKVTSMIGLDKKNSKKLEKFFGEKQ